jgi:ABC-2 type transport system permease protein
MNSSIITEFISGKNKLERLWLLAKIEFKLRYYENALGLLWALFKPISEIFIFYIAFEIILKSGIPHFVSFLFLGIILWNFFIECSSGTVQMLSTKKYLYEYTNMNKLEIYLSTIASNLIGLCFNLIMYLIFYLAFEQDVKLTWHAIIMIPIMINLLILSLGFSLILSNLFILFKDITQIWSIIIGLGFWISPILFKLEVLRNNLPGVDYINPMSGIIINARHVMIDNQLPEWDLFIWSIIYSIFFLFIGLYLLKTIGSKAAEKL